jgi:hypothetical protein
MVLYCGNGFSICVSVPEKVGYGSVRLNPSAAACVRMDGVTVELRRPPNARYFGSIWFDQRPRAPLLAAGRKWPCVPT